MRKIIIIGTIPEQELMNKVTEYATKYDAEIVYQPDPLEGEEAGIYKVGFPEPTTHVINRMMPIMAMAQMGEAMMHDIYSPIGDIGGLTNRSKYEKYARMPTEKELAMPNIGRNEPCTCGSGKKFKKCCGCL